MEKKEVPAQNQRSGGLESEPEPEPEEIIVLKKFPDKEKIIDILKNGTVVGVQPIEAVKRVPPHSNDVKVIDFGHASEAIEVEIEYAGQKIRGVFKPKDGEDLEPYKSRYGLNTFYNREIAAYLVDEALGFDMVPPTVFREIEIEGTKRKGSLQLYIPEGKAIDLWLAAGMIEKYGHFSEFLAEEKPDSFQSDVQKTVIFDYIIANPDRNGDNVLVEINEEGVPVGYYLIDNGLSFCNDFADYELDGFSVPLIIPRGPRGLIFPQTKTYSYKVAIFNLPGYLREMLISFMNDQQRKNKLREDLLSLGLKVEEVEGVFRRISNLIEKGRYL
jgi:uncharacterized protein YuzE